MACAFRYVFLSIMNKRLDLVLLIDDDEDDNFYHKRIIEKADIADHIVSLASGVEALNWLQSPEKVPSSPPDLIFLDINMPRMNGWEFLEAYQALLPAHRGKIIIMMLTTSLNPADQERAQRSPYVAGFETKPLTVALLHQILTTHFA